MRAMRATLTPQHLVGVHEAADDVGHRVPHQGDVVVSSKGVERFVVASFVACLVHRARPGIGKGGGVGEGGQKMIAVQPHILS